jgi:hypothetical protein
LVWRDHLEPHQPILGQYLARAPERGVNHGIGKRIGIVGLLQVLQA